MDIDDLALGGLQTPVRRRSAVLKTKKDKENVYELNGIILYEVNGIVLYELYDLNGVI